MEVILLERVAKLGQMGETVRVRDGYARNFLLARGKALRDVRNALVATAVLMAVSPTLLGMVHAWGARGTGGMMLSVILVFFPASVFVTIPSPLLAKLAIEARPGREGSSLGVARNA